MCVNPRQAQSPSENLCYIRIVMEIALYISSEREYICQKLRQHSYYLHLCTCEIHKVIRVLHHKQTR